MKLPFAITIILVSAAFYTGAAVAENAPSNDVRQEQVWHEAEEQGRHQALLLQRSEKMLEQQERNQQRFEQILNTWERQQREYQQYLDSLKKK